MRADWYQRLVRDSPLYPAAKRAATGGSQTLAVLEQYQHTERLAAAALALQQRALLLALARHAVVHSPHFASRLAAARLTPATLAEPGGLARLAPLSRRALVDAAGALFCGAVPATHGRVEAATTTGSTGEPVVLRRTGLCRLHWGAHTLREHLWHRRDFAARLAVVRANVEEQSLAPGWGAPCDAVLPTGSARVVSVSHPLEEILRRLIEFRPDYLLLYPSVLGSLLDLLESTGQRLDGLRGVRTLSETVSPRLRAETRRVLGLEIHDVYSSEEGGIMATQCPEHGAYHVAETVVLEVVDADGAPCAPGETGRVLVTDLLNFATPLVRYEIGDYAEVGAACPCGRGLPVIARFLGRERNLVLLPDGTRHWPLVGFYRWPAIFPVRQFQLTQTDRHTIEARFSADRSPTPAQEAQLVEVLREKLGAPFDIRCHWQTTPLPRGPGGKFEEFICLAR